MAVIPYTITLISSSPAFFFQLTPKAENGQMSFHFPSHQMGPQRMACISSWGWAPSLPHSCCAIEYGFWFLLKTKLRLSCMLVSPNHWVPALEFGPVVRRHKGCVFAINALLIFGLLQLQTGSWPAGVLVVWTTLCVNGSDAGLGSNSSRS